MEDEDIPEYINKMKSIIEEINSINKPDLEINNKAFSGVLVQSLPPEWDQYINSLYHANRTGGGPVPVLNTAHPMCNIKDEYYRHGGRKPDGDQTKDQINLSVTKGTTLANHISNKGRSDLYCKCCKQRNRRRYTYCTLA